LRAEDRADGGREQNDRQRQVTGLAWRGGAQHPRGEQQRVARQEESDEQPRLGEQHEQQAERAEAAEQRGRAQRVECMIRN